MAFVGERQSEDQDAIMDAGGSAECGGASGVIRRIVRLRDRSLLVKRGKALLRSVFDSVCACIAEVGGAVDCGGALRSADISYVLLGMFRLFELPIEPNYRISVAGALAASVFERSDVTLVARCVDDLRSAHRDVLVSTLVRRGSAIAQHAMRAVQQCSGTDNDDDCIAMTSGMHLLRHLATLTPIVDATAGGCGMALPSAKQLVLDFGVARMGALAAGVSRVLRDGVDDGASTRFFAAMV